MRKKVFLRKLLRCFLFLLGISLYLGFYLFPTIKSINKIKREVRETGIRTNDLVKMKNRFLFSDDKEETYFDKKDAALRKRFPYIGDHRELVQQVDNLSDYFQKTGRADGIRNLVIISTSKAMMIKKNLLVFEKKISKQLMEFASSNLQADSVVQEVLTSFIEQLNHQTIYLGFSGNIQSVLNFINHIPWYQYYIDVNNVTIFGGDKFPFVVVAIKMYYIQIPQNQPDQMVQPNSSLELVDFMVDIHSEILLNPVYQNLPESYRRREIPK